MMLRVAMCLMLVTIGGCANTQVQSGVLRDMAWLTAAAKLPEDNVDRQCIRSALQTSFALLAFRDGNFDDAGIESMMLGDLRNVRALELRQADFSEWKKTHKPSVVADRHLSHCLSGTGNRLPRADLTRRCFLSTEPAALLSVYRKTERSLAQAIDAVKSQYKKTKEKTDVARLGTRVYQLPTDADDLRFREALFAGCLSDAA